jgi:hypothetical protein
MRPVSIVASGEVATWEIRTIKLLTRICRILAFRLVRPAKIFWRMPIRMWPSGAATNMPYSDILGMRELK